MLTKIIVCILSFTLGVLALPVILFAGAINGIRSVYGAMITEIKKHLNN